MAWKEHSKRHMNIRKLSSISDGVLTPPNEPEDIKIVTDPTALSSEWQQISIDRVYIPCADDIGCRLRVDVTAYSPSDNSILTGPVALFTEPVLSAPHRPPKRPLQTVPGAGTGIAGALRFRIVSYNILAEIYATKQVTLP